LKLRRSDLVPSVFAAKSEVCFKADGRGETACTIQDATRRRLVSIDIETTGLATHGKQPSERSWTKNSMREMHLDGGLKSRKGERFLLVVGIMLLALWALARVHGSMSSRAAIEQFHTGATASADRVTSEREGAAPASEVDFTLWNPKRIAAYKESLLVKPDLALAILRIPKINLEVPVFNDTDDLTLNRGVGRILGTAQIGQPGNLGIAGHRDGFFRGLKDVGRDDIIELIRPGRTDRYVITRLQIVSPEDVSVLAPTSKPTLTLVTCFPFYYIGNAPQRYVVTATYEISNRTDESASSNSISMGMKIDEKEKQNEVK
jgi:sortase A